MTAEFNWWLLIVGVVVGAGLTWLVLAESTRREVEIVERELPAEAEWIAHVLTEEGLPIDARRAEAVLRAHRRYLAAPPPDALVDPVDLEAPPPAADPSTAARSAVNEGEPAPPSGDPGAPPDPEEPGRA
jgi:hypothetical protein